MWYACSQCGGTIGVRTPRLAAQPRRPGSYRFQMARRRAWISSATSSCPQRNAASSRADPAGITPTSG